MEKKEKKGAATAVPASFAPGSRALLMDLLDEVSTCMQCGTCAGSCPTARTMDYSPRGVIRLIQGYAFDTALRSRAIWMCTTCYTCTVRCPRDIPVTDVLAILRGVAIAEGYAETAGMTFNKAFLNIIRRYGRMYEPELIVRYHLRQEPLGIFGAAPVGLALLQKGKLEILPERLPPSGGMDEVRRIFERVEARQRASAGRSE